MAQIALRTYTSEIEKLIENKQFAEAIAHCKHILKYFPKHIDTYRLLGKAYLELHRYSEAADILQRVLSVVPDDFISQVGMSILREDEGNLDAALYHMERAYEIYPANPAIQEELRRLYGRRDGVEPPKIRLTRGALVRLYDRGALFPQAIAEARAALAEDPQRVDLQVLLARLYFRSGQKVQAAEISNKLVTQLPYCYEANRILADVLPGSSLAEDAKVYQERIQALDPYAAMIGDRGVTSAEVSDNAVQVERLEYQPGQEEEGQPDWARNVGVAWDSTPASESVPDWMAGGESEAPAAQADEGVEAQPAGEIPDWMAAAGWSPSDGVETAPAPFVTDESAESDEGGLAAAAEIPDWLKAMSPEGTASGETDAEDGNAWLDGLLGGAPNAPEIENILPSSQESKAIEPEMVESAGEEVVPDWLQDQPEAQTAAESAAIPDWLTKSMEEEPVSETESSVPEWLSELPVEEAASETVSQMADWQGEQPTEEKDAEVSAESVGEIPDWLGIQPVEQESAAETATDVPEWLSELPQATRSEEATDVVPDWLKADTESVETSQTVDAAANEEDLTVAESEALTEAIPEAIVSGETAAEEAVFAQPEDDMDAAMAWLEALAARQGAEEGTLLTAEDARTDVMPDWLKQEAESAVEGEEAAVEDHQAEIVTPVEPVEIRAEEIVADIETNESVLEAPAIAEVASVEMDAELPSLEELSPDVEGTITAEAEIAQVDLETEEFVPASDLETQSAAEPTFQAPDNAPAGGLTAESEFHSILPEETLTFEAEHEAQPAGEDVDDAFAWLESLAARQGAEEGTLLTSAEAQNETPPEWVAREMESAAQAATVPQAPDSAPASGLTPDSEFHSILPEETPALETEHETQPAAEDMGDDAFAWLESLAARQGADEGTLLTSAEAQNEAVPEWVAREMESAAETASAEQNVLETAQNEGSIVEPAVEQPMAEETITPEVQWQPDIVPSHDIEETLPEWLHGIDEYPQAEALQHPIEAGGDALPDWLQGLESIIEEDTEAGQNLTARAAAAEWQPEAETPPVVSSPVELEQATELEAMLQELEAQAEPVEPVAVMEPVKEELPEVVVVEPAVSERVVDDQDVGGVLVTAQQALARGDIEVALEGFNQLIADETHLEEAIHDLRDASYRYPVNSDIWQALGDAYSRSNRIQEALDAYTKAEELLR